jgi:hypothetical protein
MIQTPQKMQDAMKKDPWEILTDIRPWSRTKIPNDPDMVPIMFNHEGITYVGWQKHGTLPMLFNCEYNPDTNLWLPFSTVTTPIYNNISDQQISQMNHQTYESSRQDEDFKYIHNRHEQQGTYTTLKGKKAKNKTYVILRIIGILFLLGAIYNLNIGAYDDAIAGSLIGSLLIGISFKIAQKIKDRQ